MRGANQPGGLHSAHTTISSAMSPDRHAPLRRARSTFEHHSPPAFEEQRLLRASFGGSSHTTAAAASSSIAARILVNENDDGGGRRPAKSTELNTSFSRTLSSSELEYRPSTHDETRPPKSQEVVYSLETVERPHVESQAFRSITPRTLAQLLESEDFPSKYRLIDCRYPFEYKGGHIKHAENIHEPSEIATQFYPVDSRIPIFYCEYSQKRGPTMAHALRSYDREQIGRERYPLTDYPEMYLVDKGYRQFYEEYSGQGLCEPDHYVKMKDKRHRQELEKFRQHRRRKAQKKVIVSGDAKSRDSRRRGLKLRQPNQDYSAEAHGSKEYKPVRLEKADECANEDADTPKGRSLFGKVTTRSFFSRLPRLDQPSTHAFGTPTGPQAGRSALRPLNTAPLASDTMDTGDPLEALQEPQEQEELDVSIRSSMSSDLGSPPPADQCPIGVLSFS